MARSRMLKSGELGGCRQRVIFQPPFDVFDVESSIFSWIWISCGHLSGHWATMAGTTYSTIHL